MARLLLLFNMNRAQYVLSFRAEPDEIMREREREERGWSERKRERIWWSMVLEVMRGHKFQKRGRQGSL